MRVFEVARTSPAISPADGPLFGRWNERQWHVEFDNNSNPVP